MASEVAAGVDELLVSGRLEVVRGAVTRVERAPEGGSRVVVRGSRHEESAIDADRVINCTGPDFDVRRSDCALLQSLLADGVARPGPLGLGLDVTTDGALVDGAGRVSATISVVGPLRRGVAWETTAIPDIRRQVEALAPRLALRCSSPRFAHAHAD
jgi:uncharacterized NAD(P)/FAD-binding protein YdhS